MKKVLDSVADAIYASIYNEQLGAEGIERTLYRKAARASVTAIAAIVQAILDGEELH